MSDNVIYFIVNSFLDVI